MFFRTEINSNINPVVARSVSATMTIYREQLPLVLMKLAYPLIVSCSNAKKSARPKQHKKSFEASWCEKRQWNNYPKKIYRFVQVRLCIMAWCSELAHRVERISR